MCSKAFCDLGGPRNVISSRRFGTLRWFSYFVTDIDASKSVLGSFFAFFDKIWPENVFHSSKSRFFNLFYLVTWDDLDLYYGHKAQEMILTNVSGTARADSLALFALNIENLFADINKPEKWNISTFDLTCSVTGDPEVIKICFSSTVFPGLSNDALIF